VENTPGSSRQSLAGLSGGLRCGRIDSGLRIVWYGSVEASPQNTSSIVGTGCSETGESSLLRLNYLLSPSTSIEEFVAGKCLVIRWEAIRRQNHWFDALYNSSAAVHSVR